MELRWRVLVRDAMANGLSLICHKSSSVGVILMVFGMVATDKQVMVKK